MTMTMTMMTTMTKQATRFEKRIIIGGLPRAGTTLFRYLIDASSQIVCGPETGFFLRDFDYRKARALSSAKRLDRALDIGTEKIEKIILNEVSAISCFDKVMQLYISKKNFVEKTIWAEKSPRNVENFQSMYAEEKDLYFISLLRDGRDVVTSVFPGSEGYYCSIDRYVHTIKMIYGFTGPRHKIVRYEELTSNPEAVMRDVFNFLDMPFEPEILTKYRTRSASRDPAKVSQPKVTKPISQSWVGRWREDKHRTRIDEFLASAEAIRSLKLSGYQF